MDLLARMTDYRNLEQTRANRLTSFSKKWKSRFNQQSPIGSYRTTKAMQVKSTEISDQRVPKIGARCEAIQTVIDGFTRQVDQIYPPRGAGRTPKHYRVAEIRQAFETAYAPVKKEMEKLERVQKQQKHADDALHEAKVSLEKLQFDPTASPKKSDHAQYKVNDKQFDCDEIQRRLTEAVTDVEEAQAVYRVEAVAIFDQCQQLEEQRLNLIRKTVMQFLQAIRSTETPAEVHSIGEELVSAIEGEQNIPVDLQEWAQSHGIGPVPAKKTFPRTPAISEMVPFFQ